MDRKVGVPELLDTFWESHPKDTKFHLELLPTKRMCKRLFDKDEKGCGDRLGVTWQALSDTLRQPLGELWSKSWVEHLGGDLEAFVTLCFSWSSASPFQRMCVRGERPPCESNEDPTQSLGLQRPADEEREAEGDPQGQEANLTEEGVWGVSAEARHQKT